jgi:anti-sigma B factor antagonist
MEFTYTNEQSDQIQIYKLSGQLIDRAQAESFLKTVEESIAQGNNRIVLDLMDLKYVNSSGLNVLINILTKCRTKGGEAVISGVSKKVSELLVITKLNTVFTVAENREDALEKIKKS